MEQADRYPRIALARKQHGIVLRAVEQWRECGVIDTETSAHLTASTCIAPFDWHRMARHAFIVAIFCVVIAVAAMLADKVLMKLLARIFQAPAAVKCALFAM